MKILDVDIEIDGCIVGIEIEFDDDELDGMSKDEAKIYVNDKVMEYIKENICLDYDIDNMQDVD